jgi:hypothetical protein
MNETSLQAYWSERLAFRLTAKQAQILDDLHINGPATRAQLEKRTQLKLCCVCGRVNELIKLGAIEEFKKVQDEITLKNVWNIRIKERANVQ